VTLLQGLLLFAAGAAAAGVNAVAGGGSLFSFPAALAVGLPPVAASATNTVALTPGVLASAWAYRRELDGQLRLAALLAVPTAIGGFVGAIVLFSAPDQVFEALVPWLVLAATLVVLGKDLIWRRVTTTAKQARPSALRLAAILSVLLLLSVYGGYFGAGLGMLCLAVLGWLKPMNIHQMNALKTVITSAANAAAAGYFVATGRAHWPAAAALTAGTLLGGYVCAAGARRVTPRLIRALVVTIGGLLTVYLGARAGLFA